MFVFDFLFYFCVVIFLLIFSFMFFDFQFSNISQFIYEQPFNECIDGCQTSFWEGISICPWVVFYYKWQINYGQTPESYIHDKVL